MEIKLLPLGQSPSDKHRAAELKWRGMPPGLPPEMADNIMLGLRSGERTLADYYRDTSGEHYMCSLDRLKKHCDLNPVWAEEARRLSAKTTNRRRSANCWLTNLTICKNGLHAMTPDNLKIATWGRRLCKACFEANTRRATTLSDGAKARIMSAVAAGATMSQLAHGRLPGGKKTKYLAPYKSIKVTRTIDPEFDAFLSSRLPVNSQSGRSRSIVIRQTRAQTSVARQEQNDYHAIRSLISESNPHRDDIVARIFEDLLDGKLEREEVPARVKVYIAELNKLYPTKYAKFGNSLLVSLDEMMFDDGSTTRGDTVSRGLWD
jgi:hypothetical protein